MIYDSLYCELFIAHYAFCITSLRIAHYALCIFHSALRITHCALCILHYPLRIMNLPIPPVAAARLLTEALVPATWLRIPADPVAGFTLNPSSGQCTTTPFIGIINFALRIVHYAFRIPHFTLLHSPGQRLTRTCETRLHPGRSYLRVGLSRLPSDFCVASR